MTRLSGIVIRRMMTPKPGGKVGGGYEHCQGDVRRSHMCQNKTAGNGRRETDDRERERGNGSSA